MFTSTGKKIHISEATHRALKRFGDYITELRGEMPIKVHAWLFPMFTVITFMFWFVVSIQLNLTVTCISYRHNMYQRPGLLGL